MTVPGKDDRQLAAMLIIIGGLPVLGAIMHGEPCGAGATVGLLAVVLGGVLGLWALIARLLSWHEARRGNLPRAKARVRRAPGHRHEER